MRRAVRSLALLVVLLAAALRSAAAPDAALLNGVNRTNLMWRSDSAGILDDIAKAGVTSVRLSFAPPYENTIRTIREARQRGLRVLLAVGLGQDAFRAKGVKRRASASGLHAAHRLSTLDLVRYRDVLGRFLARLDREGLSLDALEIGNEVNWADFNGDLPVRPKGQGRFYETFEEISADREADGVMNGLSRYAEAVRIARALLQAGASRRETQLVSSGLFSGARGWTQSSGGAALSLALAMQAQEEMGVLDAVDGIGIHLYPVPPRRGGTDAVLDLARQIRAVTTACRIEQAGSKPCWITEWGFAKAGDACTLDDSDRLARFRAFRDAVAALSEEVSVQATFLYDWDDGKQFSIYRCARPLPSAGFFAG